MATRRLTSSDSATSAGAAPSRAKRGRKVAAQTPAPTENTHTPVEKIATLAYSYWETRGFQGGSPEEDWLRAERTLRNGRSQAAGA